ncbi:MAG: hypothetical protein KKB70_05495 [Proteobacteria bacterium]|nr:hypothetical protein [Pseudomonadota bacterium]MBU1612008.1 hypothetical protein [Pseudomonadota bacterium]
MKKKHFLRALVLVGLVSLLFSACCGTGRYTPKPDEIVPDTVEFIDSFLFDRSLSKAMGVAHDPVTVTFPALITLNSIPERLDKWFSKIDEFGGTVEALPEPVPGQRGIIDEIISLVISAYEYLAETCVYTPAQEYNALLYYKSGSGLVTRVVFTLKHPSTS